MTTINFWLISCPLFKLVSVRRDENISVWCFVFRVWRIYDKLMYELLSATCMVRMRSTCGFFFFVFPRSFWPFISHFSLLFLFLSTPVNTKFPNCRKSDNWKEIWFANINLYWWIMSTISISILLQKNTLWFYLL